MLSVTNLSSENNMGSKLVTDNLTFLFIYAGANSNFVALYVLDISPTRGVYRVYTQ